MELKLRSRDLVQELGLAQGVVETKTTIPVLSNVLLEAKHNDLVITSTDLELGFQTSCSAEVGAEGSITVPTKRLLDYVRLLPDAEVVIATTATESVTLSCGSAQTRIAGMERRNFPELPEMPDPLTTVPVATLLAAARRTIISVAGEQSHYTLAGALLEIRHDSVGIVSTDGHRLSLYKEYRGMEGVSDKVTGLMPQKAMSELLKILGQAEGGEDDAAMVEFAVDENNLFFRSGRRLFISRKMTGKFPDYDRVMPKDLEITLELDNESFSRVLRRVAQFSDERSHVVRFDLEDGRLQMRADVSDFGSSEESVLVDYEGDPVGVGFNAHYILEFLRVCGSEKVLLRLRDPRSAAQMEVPGMKRSKDYRYVIMPIRV
jgi:DNA polymerase-3 subunit beta